MRGKRILAAALTAATLTAAVPALAVRSSFPDITDPRVAEAAEFLRAMDVVDGVPGGAYLPGGTLTRAQFCKMAVCAMDLESQEPAQRGRTIFMDVGSSYWGRGYINLAASVSLGAEGAKTPLVSGMGDGTFQPDRPITGAEAVTILCRILDFGVTDVATGGRWYDGYLAAAAKAGLTDGLTINPDAPISRGDAALLFYNLYFSVPKGGEDRSYLVTKGGQEVRDSVLLNPDVTADDGTPGAILTTTGTYKSDRVFDSSLSGSRGTALLDSSGKLLAFRPDPDITRKSTTLISASGTALTAADGGRMNVPAETPVYLDDEARTWAAAYGELSPGMPVSLFYTAGGKLSHVFFPTLTSADDGTVMVLHTEPSGSNPFAPITGGGSYTLYKNGSPAVVSDLRKYDVGVFDPSSRILQVTDLKLTGTYEHVSPSPEVPMTVTMLGHSFPVLSSARQTLASFKLGTPITLLLTPDNRVAGVVTASEVKGAPAGLAQAGENGTTIQLLQNGLTLKGTLSGDPARYNGQLVTVSGGKSDALYLSPIRSVSVSGDLDVAARTLGGKKLADNAVIYDQVKDGPLTRIPYDALTADRIPAGKIRFVTVDYKGRPDCLVLNDVTGDGYTYGFFLFTEAGRQPSSMGGSEFVPAKLAVRHATAEGTEARTTPGIFLDSVRTGTPGGLIYAGDGKVSSFVRLESLEHVPRSAFDLRNHTVTVNGVIYPIAEQVQCWNESGKTWFVPGKEGLKAARAYSNDLTICFDRAPSQGGKVRMVIAN